MAFINGLENVLFVQVDSLFELRSAGIQPFLCNLMEISRCIEYRDNDPFWNNFGAHLGDIIEMDNNQGVG